MASNSETGHAKNVANFETLIAYCTGFGETYDPSNDYLSLAKLASLHEQAKDDVKKVKIAKAPFDEVERKRKIAFKPYKALGTKIMGALAVSGASITVIQDAETINRRMQGRRAPGSKTILKEDGTPEDRNSVSQQSYDLKIDHIEKMIELLSIEEKYRPNEIPLTIINLIAYKTLLQELNTEVKNAYVPYSNALNIRNRKLYNLETGLVARAMSVKKYLKSVYGTTAPEYKKVNKLSFRRLIKIE